MKSKKNLKNLTRFTYESAAFEGWRLNISRAGSSFTKYVSDKKYGGKAKSLAIAQTALAEIKSILDSSKRIDGKLPQTTVRKVEGILKKL